MPAKTSWREKLANSHGLPVVQRSEHRLPQWQGMMVIPAPQEVDDLMRRVPPGRVTTVGEIRAALARRHRADFACPLTTGIFAWIAAHAAEESAAEGGADVTPYWRTLKTDGALNPKYPGGSDAQAARLKEEGLRIEARGKKLVVAGYAECLYRADDLDPGI